MANETIYMYLDRVREHLDALTKDIEKATIYKTHGKSSWEDARTELRHIETNIKRIRQRVTRNATAYRQANCAHLQGRIFGDGSGRCGVCKKTFRTPPSYAAGSWRRYEE